jgi:hypothetical protein
MGLGILIWLMKKSPRSAPSSGCEDTRQLFRFNIEYRSQALLSFYEGRLLQK